MKVKQKGQLTIQRGHWWGLIDDSEGIKTWAPVGAVERLDVSGAMDCYRLARWYFEVGIIESITGPIIREDDKRVIEVIPGTSKQPAFKAA